MQIQDFPETLVTIQEKILHVLHLKGPTARADITIATHKKVTLSQTMTKMKNIGLIKEDKLGKVYHTSKGIELYNKALRNVPIHKVTKEEVMKLFTKRAKPKGIKDIINVCYPNYPKMKVRHLARKLLNTLIKDGKIVYHSSHSNYPVYVMTNSRADPKNKELCVETTKEQKKKLKQAKLVKLFFSTVTGKLTAMSTPKPYLY